MRKAVVILCVALLANSLSGCAKLQLKPETPAIDKGPCARPPFAFEDIISLGPVVNSPFADGSPCISADGLSLYFDSLRPGGQGFWDIWVTTREAVDSPWGPPKPLDSPINTAAGESGPCLSRDGLSLYFASNRPGGLGNFDIWVVTRQTTDAPWGQPTNLGPAINTSAYDNHPSISADGLSLYFDSRRFSLSQKWLSQNLYVAHRASPIDGWGPCEIFADAIPSSRTKYSPDLLPDGLTLFFDSFTTSRDLWVMARPSSNAPWTQATALKPPMNTPYIDTDPSMWVDGCILYFVSTRPGGVGNFDIWQATVTEADSGEN